MKIDESGVALPNGVMLKLRPVTEADESFLLSVYAGTRAEELAQAEWQPGQREVFLKWQFDLQRREYDVRFPDAEYKVILIDDQPAGRIWIGRDTEQIRLLEIFGKHLSLAANHIALREAQAEPPLVRRAKAYIAGHQADPVDLGEVAGQVLDAPGPQVVDHDAVALVEHAVDVVLQPRGMFPQSELAAEQTLALPVYPELRSDEIKTITSAILAF